MKKSLSVIIMTVLMALTGLNASAIDIFEKNHKEVVSVSDVYIPSGFDSGSDAFIVVNGFFNNGCYSWDGADVMLKDEFTREVKVNANVREGLCTMALEPYTKEIRLGQLVAGTHTLRFDNGDGTYFEKSFEVE